MSQFFETIKVQNGVIYNLPFHQQRLNYTIEKNFSQKSDISLKDFIYPPKTNLLYRCKVIYKHEIKSVDFYPYTPKIIKSFKIIHSDVKYPFKSTDRSSIDELFSKRDDLDEILIVDKNGFIKDTSIANIAIKKDGLWFTPKNPLLKGTMREKFLEDNILIPKEIKLKDIENIDNFAIMNAMIGFVEIKKAIFR